MRSKYATKPTLITLICLCVYYLKKQSTVNIIPTGLASHGNWPPAYAAPLVNVSLQHVSFSKFYCSPNKKKL